MKQVTPFRIGLNSVACNRALRRALVRLQAESLSWFITNLDPELVQSYTFKFLLLTASTSDLIKTLDDLDWKLENLECFGAKEAQRVLGKHSVKELQGLGDLLYQKELFVPNYIDVVVELHDLTVLTVWARDKKLMAELVAEIESEAENEEFTRYS